MIQYPGEIIIQTSEEWFNYTQMHFDLKNVVVQDVDFYSVNIDWKLFKIENATFLGCTFKKQDAIYLIAKGAFLYPKFKELPYNPFRNELYSWQELMKGYEQGNDQSLDLNIYKHFSKSKYSHTINEALAQRIHDHSIDNALRNLLVFDQDGMTNLKAIGFMGGHSARRGSEFYVKAARAAKLATEEGFFVVTGGGPGVMEAANLGAYMAGKTKNELLDAIDILAQLKFDEKDQVDYLAKNYIEQSKKVLEKYPEGNDNLAIPTWFYGHEPSNLFATHIAKYFSNSIREDILLSVSLYGIIFAPGSAGTTQEIFQEAAQNHYGSMGYISPMVFLSKERYVEQTSLYSLVHQLAVGKKYKEMLFLTDSPKFAIDFIKEHPPLKV